MPPRDSTPATSTATIPLRRALLAGAVLGLVAIAFAIRRPSAEASGAPLIKANLEARGEMCSSRNITGTGIRMEVFPASGATGTPLAAGLVPVLDVNTAPAATPVVGQVVRWTGWIKAKGQGTHEFRLPTGVKGRFTLSRVVLIGDGAVPADSARMELTANRFYPFTLEIAVDSAALGAGTWLLSWVPPKQALQPVMRGSLFPPTDSASTPPADTQAVAGHGAP